MNCTLGGARGRGREKKRDEERKGEDLSSVFFEKIFERVALRLHDFFDRVAPKEATPERVRHGEECDMKLFGLVGSK